MVTVRGHQEQSWLDSGLWRNAVETCERSPQTCAAELFHPLYNLGHVAARRGDYVEALEWIGKARAAKLSPEERSETARKAAQARWDSQTRAK